MPGEPWITLSRRELVRERPGGDDEDVHFPERLAERVIATFSAPGEVVLDPFAGFGTTAAVALRMGRRAIAVELLPERADRARQRVGDAAQVITGDARKLPRLVREPVDLCFTSPPYMTRNRHPENPLTGYSTLDGDYSTYLDDLESVFRAVGTLLRPGGHLVVNVATTVAQGQLTPLADDVAVRVARHLVHRGDLRIAWDETPPGIVDDRCLVFEKPAEQSADRRRPSEARLGPRAGARSPHA
jgi:DNA modification methylase